MLGVVSVCCGALKACGRGGREAVGDTPARPPTHQPAHPQTPTNPPTHLPAGQHVVLVVHVVPVLRARAPPVEAAAWRWVVRIVQHAAGEAILCGGVGGGVGVEGGKAFQHAGVRAHARAPGRGSARADAGAPTAPPLSPARAHVCLLRHRCSAWSCLRSTPRTGSPPARLQCRVRAVVSARAQARMRGQVQAAEPLPSTRPPPPPYAHARTHTHARTHLGGEH